MFHVIRLHNRPHIVPHKYILVTSDQTLEVKWFFSPLVLSCGCGCDSEKAEVSVEAWLGTEGLRSDHLVRWSGLCNWGTWGQSGEDTEDPVGLDSQVVCRGPVSMGRWAVAPQLRVHYPKSIVCVHFTCLKQNFCCEQSKSILTGRLGKAIYSPSWKIQKKTFKT